MWVAWPPQGLWGCPLSADLQGPRTADADRRDGVLGIVHGDTGAREGHFACLQAQSHHRATACHPQLPHTRG